MHYSSLSEARRLFSGILCCAILIVVVNVVLLPRATCQDVVKAGKQKPPNIVLFLGDDIGWDDVPWHNNNTTLAPNLAQLAATGIRLERHYTQPICSPTRAALLTGKYVTRLGWQHANPQNGEDRGLPRDVKLLPSHLKDRGYSTHMLGKWHLGFCSFDHTPVKRGFDTFYGHYTVGLEYCEKTKDGYFDFRYNSLNSSSGEVMDDLLWDTAVDADECYATEKGYYGEQLKGRAREIVEEHDVDKPLFMYYATQNIHFPYKVPQRFLDLYETGESVSEKRKTVLAMMSALDEQVGDLVQALKNKGLWENTVFVFFSDNGGEEYSGTSNAPLRGYKFQEFEGGIRTAGIVNSPLIRGGLVNEALIHVTDWLPTLLNIADNGVQIENNPVEDCDLPESSEDFLADIDGVQQWGALIGARNSSRTGFLINIETFHNRAAIRSGDWKLHVLDVPEDAPRFSNLDVCDGSRGGASTMLFNVIDDPFELLDLSSTRQDKVCELLSELEKEENRMIPRANRRVTEKNVMLASQNGAWVPWMDSC